MWAEPWSTERLRALAGRSAGPTRQRSVRLGDELEGTKGQGQEPTYSGIGEGRILLPQEQRNDLVTSVDSEATKHLLAPGSNGIDCEAQPFGRIVR